MIPILGASSFDMITCEHNFVIQYHSIDSVVKTLVKNINNGISGKEVCDGYMGLRKMKKPILYSAEISPAVRGVLLTAKAMNLDLEIKTVNLMAGEHLKPEYLKMNPQHTVPTLDDNGLIIWDSHAICTYLIDKYGKNDNLYPKDLYIRARINQRLYFNVGVTFAKTRPISEAIILKGATEIPVDAIKDLYTAYDFLESFLKDNLYLVGNSVTVADYCSVATVSTVQISVPILPDKYPKLTDWYERMKAIPFYDEVNGKRVEMYRQFIEGKLESNRVAATNK